MDYHMNERIKELAEQATEKFITYFDGRGNVTETYFDKEKFAELIVKECANMCFKASQESFRLNEVKAGAMGMALKVLIEQHFGVEE